MPMVSTYGIRLYSFASDRVGGHTAEWDATSCGISGVCSWQRNWSFSSLISDGRRGYAGGVYLVVFLFKKTLPVKKKIVLLFGVWQADLTKDNREWGPRPVVARQKLNKTRVYLTQSEIELIELGSAEYQYDSKRAKEDETGFKSFKVEAEWNVNESLLHWNNCVRCLRTPTLSIGGSGKGASVMRVLCSSLSPFDDTRLSRGPPTWKSTTFSPHCILLKETIQQ